MRAFNKRKTPKEHWLFSKRGQKIHLVYHGAKVTVKKINGRMSCREDERWKLGYVRYLFHQIERIHFFSIGRLVKNFEEEENVKISDIGVTRNDFSRNLQGISNINDRLEKYRKGGKDV